MINVLSIFGTRPEAIKMAPVIRELDKHPKAVNSRIYVTAQHREMLDQVLVLFGICPQGDLDIMERNQRLASLAANVLAKIEPVLRREKPDWVLVQGDTVTVAAISVAAFYEKIKIAHIEAGLRTRDKWHPFPEEINRRIVGVIADTHFAPTNRARLNLLDEGVPDSKILVTGNTVIDALNSVAALPFNQTQLQLDDDSKIILVTAHRRENFGEPLRSICFALLDIAKMYDGRIKIIYPVHLNPNVQKTVYGLLGGKPNIRLLYPVDYLTLVNLMKRSFLVMTDSGGIQEEAPALGIPVLVLREITERPEAVEAGTVKLVGRERNTIVAETLRLLEDEQEYRRMARAINPYGDGHAAERIVKALLGENVTPFSPEY